MVVLRKNELQSSGGTLTREQFMLREAKIVAGLLQEGLQDEEIIDSIVTQNLFQYPTERTIDMAVRACLRRLHALNSDALVKELAEGPTEKAAQINLYAMMRIYRILHAFMVEEIGERYRNLDYTFTRVDMNAFFTRYRSEHAEAARFSDATVVKLKSVFYNCLVQTGFLSESSSTVLLFVFLDDELEQCMKMNGDESMLCAFNCLEA